MRRPWSGRRSAQASSSRSAATAPITVTAGEPIPAASAAPAIVASVPEAVLLGRGRAGLRHAHGRRRILAGGDQRLGHGAEACGAHEHDERARQRGERSPVDIGLRLARLLVRGHDRDLRRESPVGHGHARVGGHGDRRCDTRHDLVRHAGRAQRERLLPAPAEEQRIAALQPHDRRCAAPVLDQTLRRLVLRQRHAARLLARVDQQAPRRGEIEQRISGQAVVDDHVGAAQELAGRAP